MKNNGMTQEQMDQKTLWPNGHQDDVGFPKEIVAGYRRLESAFPVVSKSNKVSYDSPVNFNESMSRKRHRWFPYKEGFSPSFVEGFLRTEEIPAGGSIIDPFSGVGTTAIEAAFNGRKGLGLDVSSLACFISKTKSLCFSQLELDSLRLAIQRFKNSKLKKESEPPEQPTVVSYFEREYFEGLMRIKAHVFSIQNEKIRSLFRLALLTVIEQFSTHRKAGNGQKRKTKLRYRELPGTALCQIRDAILERVLVYSSDLSSSDFNAQCEFRNESCLELEASPGELFDGALTSPPYANCFDYSKIYMCELWLGGFFESKEDQKEFRKRSLRSHVHARWDERHVELGSETFESTIFNRLSEQELWSKEIPRMLQGYFRDMGKMLLGLSDVLRSGAPVGIVVSNSFYAGIPIATDLLIAEVASKLGYKVDGITIYRHMVPSSQQYKKISDRSYFRESLVLLRNA